MQVADDGLDDQMIDLVIQHFRTFAKAILIGLMMFSSVLVITGSGWKAFVIGLSCLALSFFNTWRRFLDLASFFLFFIAMVYWCDQDIFQHIKTATTGLLIQ